MRTREEAAGDPGILLGRVATRWVAYGCWVVASWAAVTGVGCGGSGGSPTVPGPVVSPAPEPPPPDPPEAPSPGVVVTPEQLVLAEGETTTLSVRLATPPTAPVTVAASIQADAGLFAEFGKGTPLEIVQGGRLVFDADTWDSQQTVKVVAQHDFDSVDEQAAIYLDTTSNDAAYENLPRLSLPAHITDDESENLGIWVFGHKLYGPPEGETRFYGVSLSGEPTGDVVVTVASSDPGILEVTEGGELLFTPGDFEMLQWFSHFQGQGRTRRCRATTYR